MDGVKEYTLKDGCKVYFETDLEVHIDSKERYLIFARTKQGRMRILKEIDPEKAKAAEYWDISS